VGGLWPSREIGADPAEPGFSLLFWHNQYASLRREGRDEGIGGARLPVRELGLLRRAEPGRRA
jgi:hypothetical protein